MLGFNLHCWSANLWPSSGTLVLSVSNWLSCGWQPRALACMCLLGGCEDWAAAAWAWPWQRLLPCTGVEVAHSYPCFSSGPSNCNLRTLSHSHALLAHLNWTALHLCVRIISNPLYFYTVLRCSVDRLDCSALDIYLAHYADILIFIFQIFCLDILGLFLKENDLFFMIALQIFDYLIKYLMTTHYLCVLRCVTIIGFLI